MRKICCAVALFAFLIGSAHAAPVGPINEVYAEKGMVSSAHDLASKAGVEIMEKGGNAIDAAVATALALNVVEPNNIGIGGGGFTLIRLAKTGEVVFLDYREKAPAASTKDMYASEEAQKEQWSKWGGKASGVPGFLKGMFYALEQYGTMSFEEVAQPAIRLAEEGFELRAAQKLPIEEAYQHLLKYNSPADLPYLKDELPMEPGDVLRQPKLGNALRMLGKEGPGLFYEGAMGEAFVDAVQKAGGIMTMDDMRGYSMEVRKPVEGTYRGYKIYSAPPASSGGTHVVQLLNVMENFDLGKMQPGSFELLNIFGQAMRMVFADRAAYMADTAFVNVPLIGLASKEYAKKMAASIDPNGDLPEKGVAGDPWPFNDVARTAYQGGLGNEHHSTTHFSVIDADGNIVSSTNTINYWYGSRVIVPEYQILANNQMDDFSSNPESVNAPEPGKRPLSSMSPTIILDPEGKPFMTIGGAGALRILTGVTQVIMNVIDFGMGMDQAIQEPRMWTGISGKTRIEAQYGDDVLKKLEEKKYELDFSRLSICQGILLRDGRINGGAESTRSAGLAFGF